MCVGYNQSMKEATTQVVAVRVASLIYYYIPPCKQTPSLSPLLLLAMNRVLFSFYVTCVLMLFALTAAAASEPEEPSILSKAGSKNRVCSIGEFSLDTSSQSFSKSSCASEIEPFLQAWNPTLHQIFISNSSSSSSSSLVNKIELNGGGNGFYHSFAIWMLLKKLKAADKIDSYVESGVWKGNDTPHFVSATHTPHTYTIYRSTRTALLHSTHQHTHTHAYTYAYTVLIILYPHMSPHIYAYAGRTAQMVRKLMGPDFPIILIDTFLHKNEGGLACNASIETTAELCNKSTHTNT